MEKMYEQIINELALELASVNVPYEINECYEGWQLRFPWCYGDVAIHDGTYGHTEGKVESYQFPWDNGDVTVLSVDAAAALIISYYEFMNRIDTIMTEDS